MCDEFNLISTSICIMDSFCPIANVNCCAICSFSIKEICLQDSGLYQPFVTFPLLDYMLTDGILLILLGFGIISYVPYFYCVAIDSVHISNLCRCFDIYQNLPSAQRTSTHFKLVSYLPYVNT